MKIEDLIRNANEFRHIVMIDGMIFVANEFNDLTAFCVPLLRKRGGVFQVQYEIGLVVIPSVGDQERAFKNCVEGRRHLALPRTIGVENSLQSIVENGRISHWILSDITNMLRTYTLSKSEALAMIDARKDFFIEKLRRVYREKFDDRILNPLTDLP
ncbi:hypothetical protein [Parasphingorhabdus sp.]|uniref:hypothetical protein n=1 Tax=Parasphingorhabdus sp. TaxID=2709688 RepID=UPI003A8D6B95